MISVIIVVYNASKYLRFAIESVLQQSYRNFEIIVVDDGSTDSTLEILNEYIHHKNFTLIRKEHTKNLGGNRNYAIKLAKGEIIAFIDGDDIWEHDKLSIQRQYLEQYDMVCSNACLINEANEIIADKHCEKIDNDIEVNLANLVADNFVIVSSVLIKKSAVEAAGFFEDGSDTRAEDYVLWLNFLQKNVIKYINKPLLRYRIHSENWSNSRTIDWIRLLERTINIRSEYLDHNNKQVRISALKGCIVSFIMLVKVEYKNKNMINARNYLKELIKIYDSKTSLKYLKLIGAYVYISLLSFFMKNKE